ncbi:efflux RND transporter periplasmic adaptor subunit [Myxococcota bacterium]|nr:efflux RND transporter periplasmic adaptor subunit [Myxococcota bacterium]
MKRILSIVFALVVLGGLSLMVVRSIQKGIAEKKAQLEKQKQLSAMDRRLIVGVTPVERMDLDRSFSASGTLVARTQATVFSMVPGIVLGLKVQEGDVVKAGDTLARLDAAKSALGYQQARAMQAQARLNYENTKKNFQDIKTLYDQKAVTQNDYEKMELGLKMAEQQVNQSSAAVSLASASWSDATITAPIDGTVIMKAVEMGDLMTSSQAMKTSPLMIIAKLDVMKLDVFVPEKYLLYMRKGQKCRIRVDAYDHVFTGEIDQVGEMLDAVAKTLKVTILIPNEALSYKEGTVTHQMERPLKVGMFARVDILLEKRTAVATVPVDAIIHRDGFDFVFVHKDGKVSLRLIKVGVTEDKLAEVVAGLTEKEQVVVLGQRALFDGQSVRLMEEDPFKYYQTWGKVSQ